MAADRPETADAICVHTQRMPAVAERHLARARMQARRGANGSATDLRRCAEGVTRALAPVAVARDVAIECLLPAGLNYQGEAAHLRRSSAIWSRTPASELALTSASPRAAEIAPLSFWCRMTAPVCPTQRATEFWFAVSVSTSRCWVMASG
jgi:hypothetical protein